jgi:hypothetical protein
MKEITGFSKIERRTTLPKQQHLYGRTSSVIALSGVKFGHHDLQTSHHLTASNGDKQSTAMSHKAGRTLTVTPSRGGCCCRHKNSPKSCKNRLEKMNACLQEDGNDFQYLT